MTLLGIRTSEGRRAVRKFERARLYPGNSREMHASCATDCCRVDDTMMDAEMISPLFEAAWDSQVQGADGWLVGWPASWIGSCRYDFACDREIDEAQIVLRPFRPREEQRDVFWQNQAISDPFHLIKSFAHRPDWTCRTTQPTKRTHNPTKKQKKRQRRIKQKQYQS